MRPLELIQRDAMQSVVTPGRVGDASAQGRGTAVGVAARAPDYVTYSGATATVHKRLMLGLSTHGLGSELL